MSALQTCCGARLPLVPPRLVGVAFGVPGPAAAEPTPPRPKLHRCDLGMPRPFECGHIMVPVRAATRRWARPRSPSRSGDAATPRSRAWGRSSRWTAARLRLDRQALRGLADRRARTGPAAPRPRPLRHARHRPLRPDRLPGPAGRPDPGIDRDRRVRQPARPELRRLHLGRSRRDIDPLRRALGLGKIFFYGDSYGTFFGQAYAVRHPDSLRGLILDSAYPGDDPYYRTLLPAGLRAADRLPRLAGLQRRPCRPPDPGGRDLPPPGRSTEA